MISRYIKKLSEGENLSYEEAKDAMDAVLDGGATPTPDKRLSYGSPNERRTIEGRD